MSRCAHCGFPITEGRVRCDRCGRAAGVSTPRQVVLRCVCGQRYYATLEQVGRSVKCSCGAVLSMRAPAPTRPPGASARPSPPAPRKLVVSSLVVAGLCGALLAGEVAYRILGLKRLETRLEQERASIQQQQRDAARQAQEQLAAETAAEEARWDAQLKDPAFLAGAVARQRHEEEWARRLAHAPDLAHTRMEHTLLRMEQLGRDPALSAQTALEEVARLSAPPGSRVEVTPKGQEFEIKVAFRMSALSHGESGAVTKHHDPQSLRWEIEKLSARVVKALYGYCGSRGIAKLSVTCNHGLRRTLIPPSATDAERATLLSRAPTVMGRLYRASLEGARARRVADWRQISVSRLTALMTVELDELKTLQISGTSAARQADPDGELEF